MIGLRELLNARLNGFAPLIVWVHVLDCPPSYWLARDAKECISNGFRTSILILPNETVSALDLTALTGLTVHVMGQNTLRTHAIAKHCLSYAECVIHCLDGHFTVLRGTHAEQA